MTVLDHSPTTGVVTVIVILIAVAALGTLLLGCWCCLRLCQRAEPAEDEESIVGGDGGYVTRKEPFLRGPGAPAPGEGHGEGPPRSASKTTLVANGAKS
ncbi:stannin-like [Petromyzon marinus]|uniref:Stannin-like n=1 Tax=Petromyzon marinus TaxID=7757 RepID=A0AAJ7TI17_PETMA|nr:stannin-like [Petromyzon marinus]